MLVPTLKKQPFGKHRSYNNEKVKFKKLPGTQAGSNTGQYLAMRIKSQHGRFKRKVKSPKYLGPTLEYENTRRLIDTA